MRSNKKRLFWLALAGLLAILLLTFGSALALGPRPIKLYIPQVYRTDPTATPTLTPTPTPTRTPTPTATPTRTATPVPGEIKNSGFESSPDHCNGWVCTSNQGDSVVTDDRAYNGNWSAGLGNGANNRVASISQQINVPNDRYMLEYFQYVNSNELCNGKFDYITIYINGMYFTDYNICRDFNGNWNRFLLNLISYRGDTIVFRMEFHSDGNVATYVYEDDFSFKNP